MKPEHDIKKLPKWAQAEIRHLKMKIDEQREELKTLRGVHGPSPVRAESWNPEDKVPINIPDSFKLVFDAPHVRAYVDQSHPEWLYITTQDHYLEIRPVANNALLVRDADPHRIGAQILEGKKILKPLPDYGNHMLLKDWLECVKSGAFIDYDGHGNLATKDKISGIGISPSDAENYKFPKWATHIMWFNK